MQELGESEVVVLLPLNDTGVQADKLNEGIIVEQEVIYHGGGALVPEISWTNHLFVKMLMKGYMRKGVHHIGAAEG